MKGRFDYVLGVNSAGWLFPVDYTIASDRPLMDAMIAGAEPRPLKAIVTFPIYRARLVAAHIGFVPTPTIETDNGAPVYSTNFPRAIKFALRLATSVEVFGMDFCGGRLDAAGVAGNHTEPRWRRESDVLRRVWDAERVVRVRGMVHPEVLRYIRGERVDYPMQPASCA